MSGTYYFVEGAPVGTRVSESVKHRYTSTPCMMVSVSCVGLSIVLSDQNICFLGPSIL